MKIKVNYVNEKIFTKLIYQTPFYFIPSFSFYILLQNLEYQYPLF